MNIPKTNLQRIIIVGGGFAGQELAKSLKNKPYQVVLIDRHNYFTFQPLLYQVATSGLEPNSIAYPLRRLFRSAKNVFFRMAEVHNVLSLTKVLETSIGAVEYDYLVIATGSKPKFFGLAPDKVFPLKSVPQALQIRNHLLKELENALVAETQQEQKALMNVVVVGGGPSGVEMAGALGEMKKYVLPADYPEMNFNLMQVYLVEGLDQLLPGMSAHASEKAKIYLEELGVSVHLNTMIEEYNGKEVEIDGQPIPTRNLIWTAGVEAAPPNGVNEDDTKSNRLLVDKMNRVKGYDNIFAVGDVAAMISEDLPKGHPMLAPVAIQQAKHLKKNFLRIHKNQELKPFEYTDKGTMATIGRNRAVADIGKLRFGGLIAWLAWMFVHLITLVGFRNRLVTLINWSFNYFTYDKALRLIISNEEKKETVEP